jgi:two-component system sensor histidine kinase VanS
MGWNRNYWALAAGCLSMLAVCLLLYGLFDTVLNGVIVDWVENTLMYTYEEFLPSGDYGVIRSVNWDWVKPFLFWALVANGLLWAAALWITYFLARRSKGKEDARQIALRLREAMLSQRDASEIFPPEQQELAAQVAELKARLQSREQKLQQETARKNDLITYLAHDLKTPLTSVIGYLSLLDEVPDMPQAQREKYTHIALEKSQRLEGLINEFFEITRYNLQQLTLDREPVDLSYLLVQLTDEFYPILQAHGNTAELNAPETLTVSGDSAKLARVFNNILKNAVAYSDRDTPIRIRAEEAEGQVSVFVENQGRTIPPQKLESIFEKFFRLDEARATATGGAGLGLAIAKEIVTLHGGTITAQSQNRRTIFRVTLPSEQS